MNREFWVSDTFSKCHRQELSGRYDLPGIGNGTLAKTFGYGFAVVGGWLGQRSYAFQTKTQWFCGSPQAAMSRRCA